MQADLGSKARAVSHQGGPHAMAVLDLIVIGFGFFVAIVAVGILTLLAAYRH